jgi:hypothetical protein
MGFEFEGRKFSVKVSRGDYVFRLGSVTVTKLMKDWFVEGTDWSIKREPGGFVTVVQSEPRQRMSVSLDEPLEITGPTLH